MKVERNACSVWWIKLKGGDPVEDTGVGERIILQWTLSN
jgi:hypothetical protein